MDIDNAWQLCMYQWQDVVSLTIASTCVTPPPHPPTRPPPLFLSQPTCVNFRRKIWFLEQQTSARCDRRSVVGSRVRGRG